MTATVRYKSVLNTTGEVLYPGDIPTKDGDDKQFRIVRRVLAAADIGDEEGQTQHNPDGALVCAISLTENVLSVTGRTYRNGVLIDGTVFGGAAHVNITQSAIRYFVSDGATLRHIRVRDLGTVAQTQIAAGDVIVVELITGPAV